MIGEDNAAGQPLWMGINGQMVNCGDPANLINAGLTVPGAPGPMITFQVGGNPNHPDEIRIMEKFLKPDGGGPVNGWPPAWPPQDVGTWDEQRYFVVSDRYKVLFPDDIIILRYALGLRNIPEGRCATAAGNAGNGNFIGCGVLFDTVPYLIIMGRSVEPAAAGPMVARYNSSRILLAITRLMSLLPDEGQVRS